jgi:hypothetical protein
MKKTHIILLSSLIACTSRGMEKFPSLLELAAKSIAAQIKQQSIAYNDDEDSLDDDLMQAMVNSLLDDKD